MGEHSRNMGSQKGPGGEPHFVNFGSNLNTNSTIVRYIIAQSQPDQVIIGERDFMTMAVPGVGVITVDYDGAGGIEVDLKNTTGGKAVVPPGCPPGRHRWEAGQTLLRQTSTDPSSGIRRSQHSIETVTLRPTGETETQVVGATVLIHMGRPQGDTVPSRRPRKPTAPDSVVGSPGPARRVCLGNGGVGIKPVPAPLASVPAHVIQAQHIGFLLTYRMRPSI